MNSLSTFSIFIAALIFGSLGCKAAVDIIQDSINGVMETTTGDVIYFERDWVYEDGNDEGRGTLQGFVASPPPLVENEEIYYELSFGTMQFRDQTMIMIILNKPAELEHPSKDADLSVILRNFDALDRQIKRHSKKPEFVKSVIRNIPEDYMNPEATAYIWCQNGKEFPPSLLDNMTKFNAEIKRLVEARLEVRLLEALLENSSISEISEPKKKDMDLHMLREYALRNEQAKINQKREELNRFNRNRNSRHSVQSHMLVDRVDKLTETVSYLAETLQNSQISFPRTHNRASTISNISDEEQMPVNNLRKEEVIYESAQRSTMPANNLRKEEVIYEAPQRSTMPAHNSREQEVRRPAVPQRSTIPRSAEPELNLRIPTRFGLKTNSKAKQPKKKGGILNCYSSKNIPEKVNQEKWEPMKKIARNNIRQAGIAYNDGKFNTATRQNLNSSYQDLSNIQWSMAEHLKELKEESSREIPKMMKEVKTAEAALIKKRTDCRSNAAY